MPRIWPLQVAQRVRYPNGTHSDPFIVTMNKCDLARFAGRLIEDQWPEWKHHKCLTADGRVDSDKLAAARALDDFDSGSARLSCAHDGRFWETVNILRRRIHNWDVQIGPMVVWPRPGLEAIPGDAPDRRLSDGELSILFGINDEYGWQALHGLGVADPIKALARTVLSWLPRIEEWPE
jgi:hypothetical protein